MKQKTRCPVCGDWVNKLKSHIVKKTDLKHQDYYLNNTKEVIKRVWLSPVKGNVAIAKRSSQ
jgi:hypothetical protein